ncbi:MAG: hypothetical protein AAFV80_05910, partial [Bacteroidota bacterium]
MKKIMVLLALCGSAMWCSGQGWIQFFEDDSFRPSELVGTNDGGCVVLGFFDIQPSVKQGILYRLDQNGVIQWQKVFDFSPPPTVYTQLSVSPNNEILVSGYRNQSTELVLHKLDNSGNLIWSEVFTDYGLTQYGSADFQFLSTGEIYLHYLRNDSKYRLQKLANDGTPIWEELIDWPGVYFNYLVLDELDNILIGGSQTINDTNNPAFKKYDPNGNLLFEIV